MKNNEIKRQKQSAAIIDKLFMISLFLQRAGNRRLVESGLNQPQFAVLGEIVKQKNLSQKDILGDFLLEKSNLSKIIKKLEVLDLITVDESPEDKRKSVLNATKKGLNLHGNCMNELNRMKTMFTASLNDQEVEKIYESISILEELVKKIKNYKGAR